MSLQLSNGDQVCIVGGGPAGCFAALHLLALAERRGIQLQVLIFEPRNFARPGPGSCNRCAGILSSRLLQGLGGQLEISLPEPIIQADVRSYLLNLDGTTLLIERPDSQRRIVSVYRGAGPRLLQGGPVAGFDVFLLAQACARGAQHVPERVRQVTLGDRPVLRTAQGTYAADLLVLATGVNSHAPLDPGFGYRPPETEIMAQDEIVRPPSWPDDQVSVYFRDPPELVFGAMVPKGPYLNISLLGRGLTHDTVGAFMETHVSDMCLPGGYVSLCGCTPRVAVSPAGRYFGDRWVAVGDAAVTRLYKDGIGSAFYSAQYAMEAAVGQGISSRDFQAGYAPYCRHVAADNTYGRILFRLWGFTLQAPGLLRAWMRAVIREADEPLERRIHQRTLWGMFTGDEPYRDLFWLSMSPRAQYSLLRGWRGSPARWNQ
jgi:flavin-dependent dehydrogenase